MSNQITAVNNYLRELKQKGLLPTEVEICGYCIDGEVTQVQNVSPMPALSYNISLGHIPLLLASDSIIWHTHAKQGYDSLTAEDVIKAQGMERPSYMFNVHTGRSDYYDPLEVRPYEGRAWSFAHSNCWTLATDFLSRELGCETSDRLYLQAPKEWEAPGWDMYRQHIREEGFTPVNIAEAQRGDLAILPVACKVPNHCAVVWNVERNEILHQLAGGLSKVVPFEKRWRDRLWPEKMLWRHKNAVS